MPGKKTGRNSNLIIESSIKHTLSLMAFMHTHSCCRASPAQMSYHREHLNGNGFGDEASECWAGNARQQLAEI